MSAYPSDDSLATKTEDIPFDDISVDYEVEATMYNKPPMYPSNGAQDDMQYAQDIYAKPWQKKNPSAIPIKTNIREDARHLDTDASVGADQNNYINPWLQRSDHAVSREDRQTRMSVWRPAAGPADTGRHVEYMS